MSFASDFAKIQRKFDDKTDTLGRKIKLDLFSSVVKDTRVDTGRLRGNWQMSESVPISREIDRLDPTGEAVIREINSKVTAFSLSYLTNSLPYAPVWEENDAMLGRNVARAKRFVRDAARNL